MRQKSRRSALVYPENNDPADAVTNRDSASFYAGNPGLSVHQSRSSSQLFPQTEINSPYFATDSEGTKGKWKKTIKQVVNSWIYSAISALMVIFTLFGDSFRLMVTGKEADVVFSGLYLAGFVFLLVECLLLFAARTRYRWSLPFWLDLTSTLVLITHVSWICSPSRPSDTASTWLRALHSTGAASRVASRTLRVIRFLRILRLLQVNTSSPHDFLALKSDSALIEEAENMSKKQEFKKKIKVAERRRKSGNARAITGNVSPISAEIEKSTTEGLKRQRTFNRLYAEKREKTEENKDENLEVPMESKVSRVLSERSMLQVMIIVGLGTFLTPLLVSEMYTQQSSPHLYGLQTLEMTMGSEDFLSMIEGYVQFHTTSGNLYTLIRLYIGQELTWHSATDPDSLRTEEKEYFFNGNFEAIFDIRVKTQLQAALDLSMTFTVCAIVFFGGLLTTCDFSARVVSGLERMLRIVKKIAQNPLLLISSSQDAMKTTTMEVGICCCRANSTDYGELETQLLEEALKKIGAMLALGLGTAGCEIITRNIKAAGSLNPMIPGKKVLAAFCFISIRGFDVLTDILGSALLIYVNMISQVVHSYTERYQGAINRNLGEGFFAIWKFEEDDAIQKGTQMSINAYSMSVRLRVALALIACIKTVAKVSRSHDLSVFLSRSGMTAPGPFLCEQLSVGLHVGWAFEGPVGSAFKIDATYLSPHVNKTARIESATRIYDVIILASDDFVDRLDDEIKPFFRHIDTVVLKGTIDAIRLYTFDLDLHGLGVSAHQLVKSVIVAQKERIREAFECNYFNVHELFTKSEKLEKMRKGYKPEFLHAHKEAMLHYIEGRWLEAKDVFYRCLRLVPMDGPSLTILHFMEKWRFQHPEGWDGVRVLASK